MGEKSLQKKKYILETARKVFMEKGYKNVTMKDIVEACDISRGGLYLYFNSTAEIFREVLHMESEEADDVFSDSIREDATATEILALFLKEQKNCEDCRSAARNIMFLLEGLKISAHTIGVTPEMVDRELLFILNGLGVEE